MERKYKILIFTVIALALILATTDALLPPQRGESAPKIPSVSKSVSSTPTTTTPSPAKSVVRLSPPKNRLEPASALPQTVIAKLPYTTKDFSIEYFPQTKKLAVTIYSTNSSPAEKEVLNWFKQQGVKNPDSLNILWSRNKSFAP